MLVLTYFCTTRTTLTYRNSMLIRCPLSQIQLFLGESPNVMDRNNGDPKFGNSTTKNTKSTEESKALLDYCYSACIRNKPMFFFVFFVVKWFFKLMGRRCWIEPWEVINSNVRGNQNNKHLVCEALLLMSHSACYFCHTKKGRNDSGLFVVLTLNATAFVTNHSVYGQKRRDRPDAHLHWEWLDQTRFGWCRRTVHHRFRFWFYSPSHGWDWFQIPV